MCSLPCAGYSSRNQSLKKESSLPVISAIRKVPLKQRVAYRLLGYKPIYRGFLPYKELPANFYAEVDREIEAERMVRKPVTPVNLFEDDPEEVQQVDVHREESRKTPRETQEGDPQRKRHKSTASKDPADKSSGTPSDPSRRREKEQAPGGPDKSKGHAEGSSIPKPPRPFTPRFHSAILKRELTEGDSVYASPAIAHTLLRGLALPVDAARHQAKDKRALAAELMAKVVQVGQLTSAFCDASAATDSARRKEQEEARGEIQSLKDSVKSLEDAGKLAEERAEAAEKARMDAEAARAEAEAALDQAKANHEKELDKVDGEAFEAGKAAAIKELKPQARGALSKGRTEGMHQGYAFGYQQALTLCAIPADSTLWEVPPAPTYAAEKKVVESKDGSSSKTPTVPTEDQHPPP